MVFLPAQRTTSCHSCSALHRLHCTVCLGILCGGTGQMGDTAKLSLVPRHGFSEATLRGAASAACSLHWALQAPTPTPHHPTPPASHAFFLRNFVSFPLAHGPARQSILLFGGSRRWPDQIENGHASHGKTTTVVCNLELPRQHRAPAKTSGWRELCFPVQLDCRCPETGLARPKGLVELACYFQNIRDRARADGDARCVQVRGRGRRDKPSDRISVRDIHHSWLLRLRYGYARTHNTHATHLSVHACKAVHGQDVTVGQDMIVKPRHDSRPRTGRPGRQVSLVVSSRPTRRCSATAAPIIITARVPDAVCSLEPRPASPS